MNARMREIIETRNLILTPITHTIAYNANAVRQTELMPDALMAVIGTLGQSGTQHSARHSPEKDGAT